MRTGLTADASNIAVVAILTQPDDSGRQHPVAHESRKLTAAERNDPRHTFELLAVVHALHAAACNLNETRIHTRLRSRKANTRVQALLAGRRGA